MVLFEAGFWEWMMAVTQGCMSGALRFHKAVCSLKHSAEFCFVSSSQNSQKSSVMPEGSHNQNDSSCQHSGETFYFVGPKLKARVNGWLSGACSSPSGAEGGCGGPGTLCSAPQQQTRHSQQGPWQRCMAESEQSRSRAQLSLRAESGVSCAAWCCSPDNKAPSSALSHLYHPQKPKLSSNLLSHAISFLHDQIDSQCAAHVDCLSPLSIVQTMCACTWESSLHCLGSQPRQFCHLQVCSTAKGLHHFQMRGGTESSPLYKLMIRMELHALILRDFFQLKIFYDSLRGLKYGRYHIFSNQ